MKSLKMRPNKEQGLLVTFCGLDGCGKTTMIEKVAAKFKKEQSIFLTKQPTDFVRTSAIFRAYMDQPDHSSFDYRSLSLLAASDRVQHTNKVIVPALRNGMVISDRYFYSCLANLCARGYEEDRWIYEIAESIIQPDVAFFLDVPVDIAVDRVRKRPEERDRYIDIELQYRLRQQYLDICKVNNGILLSTEKQPEETYVAVLAAIEKALEKKNRKQEKREGK